MLASTTTWVAIHEYVNSTLIPVAILPVGSVEAHGPHLPLTTDSIIADNIAQEVGKRINAFVLPVLHYGQLWSLRKFPGSVWLDSNIVGEAVYEIGCALKQHGFKLFVVVNGHIGNIASLKYGLRKVMDKDFHVMIFNPDLIRKIALKYLETSFWHKTYFHAEEIETSLLLYLKPESVNMDKAVADYPEIPFDLDYTFVSWEKLTSVAVIGDPTKASKEKGKKIFEEVVEKITDIIKHEIEKIKSID